MKRAAFLLFVILSFYIAGLYRYPPLLVLSTAALLSFPLLFFLPRYLKRRLPVSRFGLYVSARYGAGQTVRKTPGADDRRPFDKGTEGRYYNTCTPYYSQRGAGLLFPAAGEVRYFEHQDMYTSERGDRKAFSCRWNGTEKCRMPVRRRRSPSIPVFRRSFFPDCRQVFDRLLQMLRFCGHMTGRRRTFRRSLLPPVFFPMPMP